MKSLVSAILLCSGNCLGTNLRPGPDGPTGNIAHECGAEECDFKILQRSGQCQRTARQGAVEIQIRMQEGRRQGRVTASGGTADLPVMSPSLSGSLLRRDRQQRAKAGLHLGVRRPKPFDAKRSNSCFPALPTNELRTNNRALRHVSMDFYHRSGAVVFRRGTGTAGPIISSTSTSSSTSAGSPKALIIAARIGDCLRWRSGGRNRRDSRSA